jgi:maltokinase
VAGPGAPEPDGTAAESAPHMAVPHPDLPGQLLQAMIGARWFAGKGRRAELTGRTPLPWLTGVGEWPAVRFEVVEISYPPDEDPTPGTRPEPVEGLGLDALRQAQGASGAAPFELYSLPVSYWPAPQPGLQHAEMARCTDPDLGIVVAYDAAQDPRAGRLLLEQLLAERSARQPDAEIRFRLRSSAGLRADLEPSLFRGQQSNTSVMYGDVAMMKLFRRLELGHNLDIEVHDALNEAGVPDVARLFGWMEAGWRHRELDVRADLGMIVEKLANAEDGWELALHTLHEGRPFADEAARLGSALAEIHASLRDRFPTDRHSGADTAAIMSERFEAAVRVAPELSEQAGGVRGAFDQLAHAELSVQRVHGDFHLGQTLHTPRGWKIIDFEGEPAKTLAERARPDSVWRDIAGMLRSFDYAGASVPRHGGSSSAGWVAACRAAFLEAYAGALSSEDAAILRAYEVDKAIYEVVYETRNRPDWTDIPRTAVAALVRDAGAEPGTHLLDSAQRRVKEF